VAKPAGLYVDVKRDPNDSDVWRATVRVRVDEEGAGFTVCGVGDEPDEALARASDRASDVLEAEPHADASAPDGAHEALAAIRLVCTVVRNGNTRDLRERVRLAPEFDELARKLEGCANGKRSMMGGVCVLKDELPARTSGFDLFSFLGNALTDAAHAIVNSPVAQVASAFIPGGPIALAAARAATAAIDAGAKPKDVRKQLEKHFDDHPQGDAIAFNAIKSAAADKPSDAKKIDDAPISHWYDAPTSAAPAAPAAPSSHWYDAPTSAAPAASSGAEWGAWGTYDDAMADGSRNRYWGDWLAEQMRAFREGSEGALVGDGGGAHIDVHDPKFNWGYMKKQLQKWRKGGRKKTRMTKEGHGLTREEYGDPPLDAGPGAMPPGAMPPYPPSAYPPGFQPSGGGSWDQWGGPQYGPFAGPPPAPLPYDPYGGDGGGWGMPAPYGYGYQTAGEGDYYDQGDEWADFSPEAMEQERRDFALEWQGDEAAQAQDPYGGGDPYASQAPPAPYAPSYPYPSPPVPPAPGTSYANINALRQALAAAQQAGPARARPRSGRRYFAPPPSVIRRY
jgi:hypothetical protein